MYKERVGRILVIGIMVLTSLFSLPKSALAADPELVGGSAVTSYSGIAKPITDLQLSGTGNPAVPVKLLVTSGSLNMTTTTGLTFTGGTTGATLQFSGTLSNVNAALATLQYTRSGTGSDTLEASLVNAGEVFFEEHLYEYVSYTGTWTQAKAQAEGRTKYGATGYLTTVTSANENAFVAARLSNAGWMGASDAANEGDWKWVTGPETGTSFWSGLSGGSTVSGRYANWGSGEPNDSSGEDCAQFLTGGTGKWNDLPCTVTTLPGYVVEYGSEGVPISISTKNVSITTLAADVTAPTITNVTSDKANGSYTVGEVIDIDVTFSETVTSTGNVTVTLETGTTDRTCTFTVSSATTGTCNYTVQVGDTTSDLTVASIAGTIRDASSNTMSSFTPATNLAANKALVIDTTNPNLSTLSPTDGATNIGVNTNLVLTFDSIVTRQTGNIVLKKTSDNSIVETIAVTSGQVTGTGTNTITVNPSVTLASETGYYVEVAATAFDDIAGNGYAGITGATAWNFTTEDVSVPTVTTLSPNDEATKVELASNLLLTFSEAVNIGNGNIVLKKTADDSVVETIAVASPQVTGGGSNSITVNPSITLDYETSYYVFIDIGAFVDTSINTNAFGGITDKTTWNFITRDKPNEETELDITNVEYSVTTDSISITWETDHDADSQVRYGTDRNLKDKKSESKNEEKHSMSIKNLDSDTVYYFRVSSEDKYGNEDESKIYSVTTKAKEATNTLATLPLETKPSVPVYEELVVKTKDTPPAVSTTPSESAPKQEEIKSEVKQSEPVESKEYVTLVTKRDDQQYIREVKFLILDEQGNPIPNLPVTLHSEPRTGVTDEKGMVVFTDVPTGEHHILFAYADKDIKKAVTINDVKNPSGEVKAEVIEVMAVRDPAPLWSWVVIIILSLALLITLWLLFRKKKKDEQIIAKKAL